MFLQISSAKLLKWADEQCPQKSIAHSFFHGLCRIFFITISEFKKNELSLRAAALTYTILLSLVPMLAMSTAVVKGLGGGDQLREVVYSYVGTLERSNPHSDPLYETIPSVPTDQQSSNLTEHLYAAVDKIFNYVDRTNFATLGTIGVVGMFLSVVLVLGNIETAMNAIWHVESGRSLMRKVADYLALVFLMPISINIGFAATAVLKSDALLSKFTLLLPMVWVQAIILKLIPIFFLTLTLYVMYLFFPHTKVKSMPALLGALFAGFFWFEVQNLYISLQVGVSRYNAIYGSFATLPLFLIWMYFGWLFILTGAQIAYACQNRGQYLLKTDDASPSTRLCIAFDLVEYVQRNFQRQSVATIDSFLDNYPMHQRRRTEHVTRELVHHQLLHVSKSDGSLKPSLPEDKMNRSKVISAVLGSAFSKTSGGTVSNEALQAAAQSFSATGVQKKDERVHLDE